MQNVEKINALEDAYEKLTNEQLRAKSDDFRKKLRFVRSSFYVSVPPLLCLFLCVFFLFFINFDKNDDSDDDKNDDNNIIIQVRSES